MVIRNKVMNFGDSCIAKIIPAEFLGLASNESLNTFDWTVTYLFKTWGEGCNLYN